MIALHWQSHCSPGQERSLDSCGQGVAGQQPTATGVAMRVTTAEADRTPWSRFRWLAAVRSGGQSPTRHVLATPCMLLFHWSTYESTLFTNCSKHQQHFLYFIRRLKLRVELVPGSRDSITPAPGERILVSMRWVTMCGDAVSIMRFDVNVGHALCSHSPNG